MLSSQQSTHTHTLRPFRPGQVPVSTFDYSHLMLVEITLFNYYQSKLEPSFDPIQIYTSPQNQI